MVRVLPAFFLAAALFASIAARGESADIPDRPPPLTFDKPVDYVAWYNNFVRRGRDEKDNAYPLYLKLCPDDNGKGGFPRAEGKAKEQSEKAVGRVWTVGEFPELAAYLKKCEPFLAQFEEASKRAACWNHVDANAESMLSIKLPLLSAGRDVVRAWRCRLWMKPFRSRKELSRFSAATLRFANHLEDFSILIADFVAVACRTNVYEEVVAALNDKTLPAKCCHEMLKLCRRWDRGRHDLRSALLVEWAVCLDGIQLLSLEKRRDPAWWRRTRGVAESLEPDVKTILSSNPDPKQAADFAEKHHTRQIKLLKRYELTHKGAEELAKLEESAAGEIRANSLLKTFVTRVLRAYRLSVMAASQRNGTMTTLAIMAHHAEHGEWPKDLKSVDPAIGGRNFARDSMDPYSGKRLIYRLKGGQPILYSVGVNGDDDGGKHHPNFGEGADGPADHVFWPPPDKQQSQQ